MKFVLSLGAMLALAAVLSVSVASHAEARCWKRCHRWAVAPVIVPAVPVVRAPAVAVIAVPAPNPIPRREPVPCCGAYVSYVYPSYTYPGRIYAFGGCGFRSGCYPRRDCWYDGYGRHFCN